MRKVKFGKRTAVAAAILVLCVGLAYGAVVNYLSNTITKQVTVESPIDLSGTLTYRTIEYKAKEGVTAPTIDGSIGEGEWGDPDFQASDLYKVYVMDDSKNLYVALETLGGTYLAGSGMTNVYIMNPKTLECWAYCWGCRDPNAIELKYSYPPDIVGEPKPTNAKFAVTEKVFELNVPLSELTSITFGPINFHFLSYAEGWNDWINAWLYDQGYILGEPVVVTETFEGPEFSETLHGGDEFSMSFNATNLANNPVEAPLALVMTCPGGWTEGSLYPITLSSIGDGTAEWSAAKKQSGSYSAKLCVKDGAKDWAEVSIPVDIAINEISSLSFWRYIESYAPNGWDVNVVLGVDCDGDGFEADVARWHFEHDPTALGDDSFISMEHPKGSSPVKGVWQEINPLQEYKCWEPTGTIEYSPFGDFVGQLPGDSGIYPTDRVKLIVLQIGGSGSWMDEVAYVDSVTINDGTYDLELEPVVLEILEIDPAPYTVGLSSGGELVMVFDELGTIGPGATKELPIRMKLASNAEEGEYTIKALIVWEGAVENFNAIASAAGSP